MSKVKSPVWQLLLIVAYQMPSTISCHDISEKTPAQGQKTLSVCVIGDPVIFIPMSTVRV